MAEKSGVNGVDKETEFFNGKKWKKISDYKTDDKVLAWFSRDGRSELEYPKHYFVGPAAEPFYHYESDKLDMCMSASHKVGYYSNGEFRTASCQEIYEEWSKGSKGFMGQIPMTFNLEEKEDIEPLFLRIAAMIHENGEETDEGQFDVYLYEEVAIKRAEWLLGKAGIQYERGETTILGNPGFIYSFEFPFNPAKFPKEWLYFRKEYKEILLEELSRWNTGMPYVYWTTSREGVDFIQMMAHSCGYSTSIKEKKPEKKDGRPTIYELSLSSRKMARLTKKDINGIQRIKGTFKEEREDTAYGFEVSTGFLVLRRNNKIFISGDCMVVE